MPNHNILLNIIYAFILQVHSTESAANHNSDITGGADIGVENDVYGGIGGRTTVDFFRSKTMPR